MAAIALLIVAQVGGVRAALAQPQDAAPRIAVEGRRHAGAWGDAARCYEEFGFTLADFTGRPVPFVYLGAPRSARIGLALPF